MQRLRLVRQNQRHGVTGVNPASTRLAVVAPGEYGAPRLGPCRLVLPGDRGLAGLGACRAEA